MIGSKTKEDPKLLFKFKHLYTVSDGSDKKYEERKRYDDFLFKWLHWSFLLSDGQTIMVTDENRVHLFKLAENSSSHCTYSKSIDFEKNSDLKGVCKYSPYNNNLCIVDQGTSSVLLVNENFKVIKKLDFSVEKKRWLYSCEFYKHQIFVVDRDNSTIIVINSNFEFLKEIEVLLPVIFKKKISLREIIIRDEKIYLTDNDHGNQSMHIYDLNLNYIRSFGLGLLNNPYAFFFYKNDYIFVIERSNKISIFDINDLRLKVTKTLANCECAINGIIVNNTIFITSLLTVQLPQVVGESCNEVTEQPYLVTKIDAYEII
jgi:hypothetical protein